MEPAQIALARHHSYTWLSYLYREGITAEHLPTIRGIPALAADLPQPFNSDDAAADHHHLFGLNLFPYETVFLGTDGLLGGAVTERVLQHYHQAGYQVDTAVTSPDHISHELGLLAFLCGAEADAWEDDLRPVADRMRQRQREFLHKHLLCWLLPLVLAIRQQGHPFYTALADLTAEFIFAHVAEIASPQAPEIQFLLPDPPLLLEDNKTSLKDFAAYLLTPAYSGIFLSRDSVSRLARQQHLPRGFGQRRQMLADLMFTAVQYDSLPELISNLEAIVTGWQAAYQTHAITWPQAAPFSGVWQERTMKTIQLLSHIRTSAELVT